MTTLTTAPFWRTLGARAGRNAIQVLVPVAALAVTGQIDSAGVFAVGAAAVLAALLSAVKTLAGLTVDLAAPAWQQALERALAAAAGAVAGLLPLDLAGALAADWRTVGVAACGAAALSLFTWVLAGSNDDTGAVVGDPSATTGA